MVKRFFASRRTGFYLAVAREGEVGSGDEMKAIARDPNSVPVSEITRLYAEKRYGDSDVTSVQRALRVGALPVSWKEYFREPLERVNA
jgi:MOSC domain-containing protein YiiM